MVLMSVAFPSPPRPQRPSSQSYLLLWRAPGSFSWAQAALGGISSMSESSLGPRSVIFFELI